MENRQLLIDGAHGIYVPQVFVGMVDRRFVKGVTNEDWNILAAGPDHEWYWETWDTFLNNAVLTSPDGQREYCLEQDGDLFICLLENIH